MHKELWVQHLQALAARERAEQPHPNEVERLLMPDAPMGTTPAEKLIALEKPEEIQASCASPGVTEPELTAAVATVGMSVDCVREHLTRPTS